MRLKYYPKNYHGFDHSVVDRQFTGGLTYVGDFPTSFSGVVKAVYRVKKPDKSKGHKRYMVLYKTNRFFVAGMTLAQLNASRLHHGVKCEECGEVLASMHRHQMVQCGCYNGAFADGGSSYLRSGGMDLAKVTAVSIDLLTGKVSKWKKTKAVEFTTLNSKRKYLRPRSKKVTRSKPRTTRSKT